MAGDGVAGVVPLAGDDVRAAFVDGDGRGREFLGGRSGQAAVRRKPQFKQLVVCRPIGERKQAKVIAPGDNVGERVQVGSLLIGDVFFAHHGCHRQRTHSHHLRQFVVAADGTDVAVTTGESADLAIFKVKRNLAIGQQRRLRFAQANQLPIRAIQVGQGCLAECLAAALHQSTVGDLEGLAYIPRGAAGSVTLSRRNEVERDLATVNGHRLDRRAVAQLQCAGGRRLA